MSATLPALLVIVHLLVFVGLGHALRGIIGRDGGPRASEIVLQSCALSALAGYVTFWAYFFDQRVGLVVSLVMCAAGILEIVRLVSSRMKPGGAAGAGVVAIMAGVSLFYVGILFLVPAGVGPGNVAERRFMETIPLDNLIPEIFADRLWGGTDPRGFPNGWLSSDRPPLQAGILLVQRPLAVAGGHSETSDLALGIVAQVIWIPALLTALEAVGLSRRSRMLGLAFAVASGFMFFNSVFVWPKLMAGAFATASIAVLLRGHSESRRLATAEWLWCALYAGLALLSHSAVAFTFIGLVLALPLFRRQVDVVGLVMGCVLGVMLLAPWAAYQKFYEPPANRLAKWHLAGVSEIDERPFGRTLADSYRRSAREIVDLKLRNAAALVGPWKVERGMPAVRMSEFRYFFHTFGVASLGWLVLLFGWRRLAATIRAAFAVLAASLLAWVVVLYGPGQTLAPHGSFGTTILAWLVLGSVIVQLPSRVVAVLLSLHVTWFVVVWMAPVAADGVWVGPGDLRADAVVVTLSGLAILFAALRAPNVGNAVEERV